MSQFQSGVAEPGGGGPGGPCPPPKILTTGPPKSVASGQNLCQIASEHFEMCKNFKIFRLRRANMGKIYSSGD